jgi:hypothetical protein
MTPLAAGGVGGLSLSLLLPDWQEEQAGTESKIKNRSEFAIWNPLGEFPMPDFEVRSDLSMGTTL